MTETKRGGDRLAAPLPIGAAILLATSLACGGGAGPTAPDLPGDWRSLVGGCPGRQFSFQAPPDVGPVPTGQAIDSCVDAYEGSAQAIRTDLGWYSHDVSSFRAYPEYVESHELIDGREALVVTAQVDDVYLAAATFPEVRPGDPPTRFSIIIRAANPATRAHGLLSIRSIDFE